MSAAQYNLNLSRGEDFNFTLRVIDAFEEPIMFMGSTYVAEIREEHKKPLVASFVVEDIGDGTLKFTLPKAASLALDAVRKYKWDFFWTQSGVTTKLLYGSVTSISNISNL